MAEYSVENWVAVWAVLMVGDLVGEKVDGLAAERVVDLVAMKAV